MTSATTRAQAGPGRVTLLAGGVGGAKLAHGVCLTGARLDVVVNTADDVELHGLAISPDLDTVTYTLAGVVDPDHGWGRAGETFATLGALADLGEPTWFRLGDRDLATHIVRTARRRAGMPLSEVTALIAGSLGVPARLLPMSDDPVATVVETPAGPLGFQEYFVARGHQDEVVGLRYEGAATAAPGPGVLPALADADIVVIAPSNPLLSIAPILAVDGVRAALAGSRARRVAVSPIVGGRALRGPAAAVLGSLGHEVSPVGVARIYAGLVDAMVLDRRDASLAPAVEELGIRAVVTDTVMTSTPDRERLARTVLTVEC